MVSVSWHLQSWMWIASSKTSRHPFENTSVAPVAIQHRGSCMRPLELQWIPSTCAESWSTVVVPSPFEVRSKSVRTWHLPLEPPRWHADDMPSFSSSTVYVVHSCLLAMCQRQQSAFWLESKFRPVIGGHAGKSVLPLFSQDREDLTQWCECNSKVISFLIAVLSRNNVARGNFTTTSWTGVL